MSNPYQVLGVPKDAKPDQIKRAFRKKAKATHPDKGGNPEEFHLAQRAFALLMDCGRRADFDATGNTKEPQIPQPMEILMACFGQALQMWIEEKLTDIRKGIETGLTNNIVQLRQQIKDADAKTARLKKLQGKVEFKGEGPNFAAAQIDAILNGFAEEKKKRERLLSDHEAALAMLPHFVFPPPDTEHRMVSMFGGIPVQIQWSQT